MVESADLQIKFISFDKQEISVGKDSAFRCKFIEDMLEGMEEVTEAIELTNENLTKDVLEKVFEFCMYLKDNSPPNIQKPIKHPNLYDITSPWYAKFAEQFDDEKLCIMILGANFLNCQDLLDLLSAKLCLILKEKNVVEIRKFFGASNDFSPDEEGEIKQQNNEAKEIYDIQD